MFSIMIKSLFEFGMIVLLIYGYAHERELIAFEQRLCERIKRPALKGMYKTVRETEEYVIVKERRK